MNKEKVLIIIKGEDKTEKIDSYEFVDGRYTVKYKGSNKIYNYNKDNISFIKDKSSEIKSTKDFKTIKIDKKKIKEDKCTKECNSSETKKSNKSSNVFEYLKELAGYLKIENEYNSENNTKSDLYRQYEKIDKINKESVLYSYLERKKPKTHKEDVDLIFPFGFNISQKEATKNAMENQVSIIEGPPGTGKTQTILNIIANAYINGKTVGVVSNNNSATSNVKEKLDKYGVGFIAAFLGSKANKEKFIENQKEEYPNMKTWKLSKEEVGSIKENLKIMEKTLDVMLSNKNKVSKQKEEKEKLIVEKKYFDDYYSNKEIIEKYSFLLKLSPSKILSLLVDFQLILKKDGKVSFKNKLKYLFKYGIYTFDFYKNENEEIVASLQKQYYTKRLKELNESIDKLEAILSGYDFNKAMKEYSEKSMMIFKSAIKKNKPKNPPIFQFDDLWKKFDSVIEEYPVILSTTHSIRKCIKKDYLFDYIIIDESSQVDIVAGALAFSCAKNVVIVGDLKQLSNVIESDKEEDIRDISTNYNIKNTYRYEENSILSSALKVYKSAKKTLLKEHYRCNPKIIGFCNEKFYNNELVILTEKGEGDPIKLYKTVKGNHARGHYNQREIDVIYKEAMPELDLKDKKSIGIVTPYREQVNQITRCKVGDIDLEVDTVHKYQGREKDTIILSTVVNGINKFVDDSSLINVAVSRAVNKLILVVSGNDEMQNKDSNMRDLIRYIQYNNYEIIDSKIHSVFDLLYSSYSEELLKLMDKNKKVSEFDSENLMNIVIKEVLENECFDNLSYVMHQPLRMLIKDKYKLNEDEKRFVNCPLTHTDFLIFNRVDKSPLLVIEVDGCAYHENNEKQFTRDEMKDKILKEYGIQVLRLKTNGSEEKVKIFNKLKEIINQ